MGLANIRAEVPDIDANKDKILRAAKIFKERGVNVAIFPEFSLSGYFWDERDDCQAYMEKACTDDHKDWLDSELQTLLDDTFRAIILNNLRKGSGRALPTTPRLLSQATATTWLPRTPTTRSSCRASRRSTPIAAVMTAW